MPRASASREQQAVTLHQFQIFVGQEKALSAPLQHQADAVQAFAFNAARVVYQVSQPQPDMVSLGQAQVTPSEKSPTNRL